MMVQKLRNIRTVSKASVAALVVVVMVFAGTSILTKPAQPSFALSSGTGFTITSTVTASPSCSVAARLYPGTPRCLTYTVHNSLKVPITVNSLSIAAVAAPSTCPANDLDLSGTTFSGSLTVPATGTNSTSVPVSLTDTGTNQNLCQGASFNFTYSGTATYTEAYVTATAVTSSRNPSNVGQSVTYTATVTATVGSGQDPAPNSPTGAVTFKDGVATICTANIPVMSASGTTSTALCSPPTHLTAKTHPITAIYTSTDPTNFSSTTSPVFNQTVNVTPPSKCTGSYANTIVGSPSNTTVTGTNNNDLIFAFGANYTVNGFEGNDCLDAGDGNNSLTDGNGSDTVVAGNGSNNITVGNGSDTVVAGNGNANDIVVGNGNDTITLGTGSYNSVTMGNRTFYG